MFPDAAVPLQLAFLTGQSDPRCCALSPAQQAFGAALLAPGRWLHPLNFPYRKDSRLHGQMALLRASWHNGRQYLQSRQASFAQQHGRDVQTLLQDAPHTVLLAGSCGLELLANLGLPDEALARTSVFAYGPVARRAPAVARLQAVVGRRDWVAHLGWRGAATPVRGGHLDYLQQPEVLALARSFVDHVQTVRR
jgi:hypothetical protein